MTDLRLDWCSYEAAKYACETWHYSECMPSGKTVKIGVWEDEKFIGTVIYTRGASPWLATPFDGVVSNEVAELARVALDDHETPTSRILSISLKLLQENSPGIRIVVSFADPMPGHDGTLYQASNWIYTGRAESNTDIQIGSEKYHERSVGNKYGTSSVGKLKRLLDERPIRRVSRPNKYKYVYPLDDGLRPKVEAMSKPYP